MDKNEKPKSSELKVELDLSHREEIEAVHERRNVKGDAEFAKQRLETEQRARLAKASVKNALAGKFESTPLIRLMAKISACLVCLTIFADYINFKKGDQNSFFLQVGLVFFVVRPYVLLNLVSALSVSMTGRLRLLAKFREITHVVYMAKLEKKILSRIERELFQMRILNHLTSIAICVLSISVVFCAFGWEPAFTDMGGPGFTLLFFFGMGMLTWLAMHKLFALTDK